MKTHLTKIVVGVFLGMNFFAVEPLPNRNMIKKSEKVKRGYSFLVWMGKNCPICFCPYHLIAIGNF